MSASAAFCSFPSQERGILLASTYKPLSLHAANVHVHLLGYAAQVTLSLEYINETNKLVKAIAAFPAPPSFQLQETTLQGSTHHITARTFDREHPSRSVEAASAIRGTPIFDVTVTDVATQKVPWDINPGEATLMSAVYHVNLSATQRTGEVALTLPACLIPAVQRPADVQRAYMDFLDARSRLRHLAQEGGTMRVSVDAQLFVPLRGVVTMERGGEAVPEVSINGANISIEYRGDASFCLTYDDDLPLKNYLQLPLRIRAPVGETAEPLRLHTAAAGDADDTAAIALSIAPTLSTCPINAEVIFMVDVHSGAVAEKVARAVVSTAQSLVGTACLVNIIVCREAHRGGAVMLLPDKSVVASALPWESALAYMMEEGAQSSSAAAPHHRGDTSALLPTVLRDATTGCGIAVGVPDGYVRNIIVLSDAGGQATDAEVAAMVCGVANSQRSCRVHTVALKADADQVVLEQLAEAAGGCFASAVVPGTETADGNIMEALQTALSAAAVPTLSCLRMQWEVGNEAASSQAASAAPLQSPLRLAANSDGLDIPCIPDGKQRLLYGLLAASAARQLSVHLTGRVGDLVVEYTASTTVPPPAPTTAAELATAADGSAGAANTGARTLMHIAAAAARIEYLTHLNHRQTDGEAEEVMTLSRRYALPSPSTILRVDSKESDEVHVEKDAVHAPSTKPAAQICLAIRARRVDLQAAASRQFARAS